MPWGAVAGAVAGSAANSLFSKDKNGGAGSSTASKEPWMDAAPWLRELINQGTDLSNDYAANPFSPVQQQAYSNQYALSDGMRGLIPGLLGQLSGSQVGFDPNNPTARPKSFDFSSILGQNSTGTGYGLQGDRSLLSALNSGGASLAGWNPPTPGAAAPAAPSAPAMLPVEWAQLNNRF